MAVKVMTPVKGDLNKIAQISFEAAEVASDGMQFTLPRNASDEYVIVVVHNTGDAEYGFTVQKPKSGSYYASASDETFKLPAGAFAAFRFESAKWANRDGTILCVPENVAVKAAVIY